MYRLLDRLLSTGHIIDTYSIAIELDGLVLFQEDALVIRKKDAVQNALALKIDNKIS